MYDYSVFIGRMQPVHYGHIHIIKEALKISKKLIILLGSTNAGANIYNPWNFEERKKMIFLSLNQEQCNRIIIIGIKDYTYDNKSWVEEVCKSVVRAISDDNCSIVLVGFYKDKTSYYLNLFPKWDLYTLDNYMNINATDIRTKYFIEDHINEKHITPYVYSFLNQFRLSNKYNYILQTYLIESSYIKQLSSYSQELLLVFDYNGHIIIDKIQYINNLFIYKLPSLYICNDQSILSIVSEFLKKHILQDSLVFKTIDRYAVDDFLFKTSNRTYGRFLDAKVCKFTLDKECFLLLCKHNKNFISLDLRDIHKINFYGDHLFILQYFLKYKI